MNGLNKVQFIGHLGADPTVINFQNGGKKVDFSLATQDGYRGQDGEWINTTDWHKCTASGKTADIIERYFRKGMQVYVEGKLKTRKWQDKNGVTRYTTEVKVYDFMFVGRKDNKAETGIDDYDDYDNQTGGENDDLPF